MSCKDCNHFYIDSEGYRSCVLYPYSAFHDLKECPAIERKLKEIKIKGKPVPITTDTIQRRLDAI